MHIKNEALCEVANYIRLILLSYGRSEVGQKWNGEVLHAPFSFLYYIVKGGAVIQTASGTMPLSEGNWYILPSQSSFRYVCDSYMDHIFFHLQLCSTDNQDFLQHCRVPLTTSFSGAPDFLFQAVRGGSDVVSAMRIKHFLYEVLISILTDNQIDPQMPLYSDVIKKAIEYISLHPSAQLTTTGIAQNAFVSKSTLTKHFQKELSMSVQEYVYHLILSRAAQMLLQTDASILQISETLGFSDQFYFSRRFRARYGIPPSVYRKRLRGAL